jgi:hypothetical protein
MRSPGFSGSSTRYTIEVLELKCVMIVFKDEVERCSRMKASISSRGTLSHYTPDLFFSEIREGSRHQLVAVMDPGVGADKVFRDRPSAVVMIHIPIRPYFIHMHPFT